MNPLIITILSACFASTGFWAFLTAIIQKRAKDKDGNAEILKAIKELKEDVDNLKDARERDNADCARNRILRFDDELRRHVDHSEEFFNQILDDTNYYEGYCATHDTYPNSKAESAIKHIRECYQKCKDENKFI